MRSEYWEVLADYRESETLAEGLSGGLHRHWGQVTLLTHAATTEPMKANPHATNAVLPIQPHLCLLRQ